jgi:hypothetical protein
VLTEVRIPFFTAHLSLYKTGNHYGSVYQRGFAGQLSSAFSLGPAADPNPCCGQQDEGGAYGCCNSDEICVVNHDGNFAGCCLKTQSPCFNSGGDLTGCCDATDACCLDNGCIGGNVADPCSACGDPCEDNRTCCLTAERKAICADIRSDSKNCGSCNYPCPAGYSCQNGTCVAPAPDPPPLDLCRKFTGCTKVRCECSQQGGRLGSPAPGRPCGFCALL